MISDSERREVAATMRAISVRGVRNFTLGAVLNSILTSGAPRPTKEMAILARLADLIDRPTCHMEGMSRSGFRCSACGEQIPPMRIFYRDSAGDHWVPMEHNRCPMCGAEVVTDDD